MDPVSLAVGGGELSEESERGAAVSQSSKVGTRVAWLAHGLAASFGITTLERLGVL
jgi:hypothetical protein